MRTGRRSLVLVAIALAVAIGCAAGAAQAARPPAGRTYFTVFLGLDATYARSADCLRFTATGLCTSSGLCGSWVLEESVGRESGIRFEIAFEEDGVPVKIDGRARINDSGKRDTLAATARMLAAGQSLNFGFTGRSTGPRNCLRKWAQFSRRHPPLQGEQNPACLQRAAFGEPAASLYVLPYPAGKEYRVSQTYCYQHEGHRDQLAYDFVTPIGSQVVAARGGVVRETRQDLADNAEPTGRGDHNHIFIEHDDGTVAFYAHLRRNGVLVAVGERVERGQLIAYNGSSGDPDSPHLHFGVYRAWPVSEGDDVPVVFRNAMGPLDERGGLYEGVFYRANAVETAE